MMKSDINFGDFDVFYVDIYIYIFDISIFDKVILNQTSALFFNQL